MQNVHAHRARTGEHQTVHAGVGEQFLAQLGPVAGEIVEHAHGQAGALQRFVQTQPRVRRVARGFEDHRVARDECAGGHARGEGKGEIKRRHDRPHAVGLQAAARLLAARAAHRLDEALLQLHLPAIVENQVHRLGNFGDRLEAILPHLEGELGRVLELVPRDFIRRRAQKGDARLPAQVAPVGKGPARRFNRLNGIGPRAALEMADELARVGGIGIGKRAGAGLLRLAAQNQRMRGTELVPGLIQRRVEFAVKVVSE